MSQWLNGNKWAVIKIESFYPSVHVFESEAEAQDFYNKNKAAYEEQGDFPTGIMMVECKESTGKLFNVEW